MFWVHSSGLQCMLSLWEGRSRCRTDAWVTRHSVVPSVGVSKGDGYRRQGAHIFSLFLVGWRLGLDVTLPGTAGRVQSM